MKKITVTKQELVNAFARWDKQELTHPEQFSTLEDSEPESQANYLIELIEGARP